MARSLEWHDDVIRERLNALNLAVGAAIRDGVSCKFLLVDAKSEYGPLELVRVDAIRKHVPK